MIGVNRMKAITQAISCFLCCLLTMLTLCSCQTEAANKNDNQEDKKYSATRTVTVISPLWM